MVGQAATPTGLWLPSWLADQSPRQITCRGFLYSPARATHGIGRHQRVDTEAEGDGKPQLLERVAGREIKVQEQPQRQRMKIGRLFDRLLVDEPRSREPENAERGDEPAEEIHPRRRIPAKHVDVRFPKPIMPRPCGEWFETGVENN